MKTNNVSYVFFFTLNSSILLELLYHPQFLCDRTFLNVISANQFFITLSVYLKYG